MQVYTFHVYVFFSDCVFRLFVLFICIFFVLCTQSVCMCISPCVWASMRPYVCAPVRLCVGRPAQLRISVCARELFELGQWFARFIFSRFFRHRSGMSCFLSPLRDVMLSVAAQGPAARTWRRRPLRRTCRSRPSSPTPQPRGRRLFANQVMLI